MDTEKSPDQDKRLYEEIMDQIQSLIRKGDLKAGDKLPPERTLAETFKVSRNCVREAIRALSEKKLLRSRRGDGTYVCAPDESALVSSLARVMQMQKSRLRDIFEFRRLLEPQIAALAAHHITPEELARLKILVFDQEKKILAGEDVSALDTEFHLSLAHASGNKILQEVVKTLNGILAETRSEFLQSDERRKASVRAHIRIIAALEKGDAETARQAMRYHLEQVEQTVFGEETRPG